MNNLMRVPHMLAVVLLGLGLLACAPSDIPPRAGLPIVAVSTTPAKNLTGSCPERYVPGLDYFPQKAELRYAKQFTVSYHGNYKRLRFQPNVKAEGVEDYLLVQCGTPVPEHDSRTRVVIVPAQRMILASQAFVSSIVRMGLTDALIGVSSIQAISHPLILERHRQGLVKEVGSGPHSSVETAIATDTDLLFTFYSAWPNYNTHPKLWEVGIHGMPLADHFEEDPLGRTEWIKYLALFFNREQEAEAIFAPAAQSYEELKRKTAQVSSRPQVLVGWPSGRDIWNLNGARNYFARMIEDAGGQYFWHDDLALSLVPVNFETVYDQQSPTRFWISRSYSATTRRQLAALNPTMSSFSSFRADGIYSPDKNVRSHRRSPWQDHSLDHPDVVLADLMRILHPELLPTYDPFYIRKVE
jgi:iron complex transport system substrate-binding protein